MTFKRKIRLYIEPISRVFFALLSHLYGYKTNAKLSLVLDTFYTHWIIPNFKSIGKGVMIHRPLQTKGEECISIGEMTEIGKNGVITAWNLYGNKSYTPSIEIGDNCHLGENIHITCINHVAIGNKVLTGRWVTISDNSHGSNTIEEKDIAPTDRQLSSKGPVIIEDRVWIGDKVTILPGVHICEGAVIAANSVVTKDVPPFCVIAGNPATIVKTIK